MLLGILGSKCRKDPPLFKERPDVYYDFRMEDTMKVAYHTGRETLRFIHTKDSISDTVTYVGQGKVFDDYCLDIIPATDYESDYAEYGKSYNINFNADKPGMDMDLEVITYQGSTHFSITIQGESMIDNLTRVNWSEYSGYFPQKELNGKMYYNVNYFIGDSREEFYLYYTSFKGIVQMVLNNKETFDLIN